MRFSIAWLFALIVSALIVVAPSASAVANSYSVHPLVSNVPGAAPNTDPALVNGWGLTAGPMTPWWVADNGTNLATLYNADGTKRPLNVHVPNNPTGAVFWSFTKPFFFVFAGENGTIRAWNPALGDQTVVVVDHTAQGAVYKGLTIASTSAGDRFYATDFHNGRVDVFDETFTQVTKQGAFTDSSIPDRYAPFGIQNINGRIFVTYAKQDADRHDDVAGQGHGFVDVYDTEGNLLARAVQHGQLNSPWGLALAPASFGRFGGDLLVGNFGDGNINAYEETAPGQFEHRGELRTADGKSLAIDGLWSLQFGHGAPANGPRDTLFFTAGPNDESDGLFGSITAG